MRQFENKMAAVSHLDTYTEYVNKTLKLTRTILCSVVYIPDACRRAKAVKQPVTCQFDDESTNQKS